MLPRHCRWRCAAAAVATGSAVACSAAPAAA